MEKKIRNLALYGCTYILGALTSAWYFNLTPQQDNLTIDTKPVVLSKLPTIEQPAEVDTLQLVESNKRLKLEIAQLSEQLTHITARDKTALDEQSEEVEQKKPTGFMSMMTPDFLKSTLTMQLSPVTAELTNRLALSDAQSTALAQLLKQKAEADIDANAPMLEEMVNGDTKALLEKSFDGELDENEVDLAIKDLLTLNQENYQEELSDLLTSDQLETYQSFEQEKQQQEFEMVMAMESNMVISQIPSLNEYQKKEINRFFQQRQVDFLDVKIGTYGSPFAQSNMDNDPQLRTHLQEQLEQLLSAEQLQEYQKTRSQWFDGMANMMGG
ncbi:hypothetical protein [Pseudoalteromonas denitrificans]|uniref:Uncharacterized protein n=1 Tax=Pseudoalteromonas denitrificans DSM 6059 TaxID=1123010 RepID=A0A1I1MMF7_9GAMM|nr:hypothetical protein [Pseudoalteromonas denitrificans]SFC86571.1 hypothetical protein SAMN02745724_02761 [Pseudoalteromonas denitrificans DSM 6059]